METLSTTHAAETTMPLAHQVKAGQAFWHHGFTVVALRDAEPTEDRFGQQMTRIWANGDGREGWVIFGPDIRMLAAHGVPTEYDLELQAETRR